MEYQCASDGTVTVSWHEHDGCAAADGETDMEYRCSMRCEGGCNAEVDGSFTSGSELVNQACLGTLNVGAGGEGGSK
jgi:hypothetical protein